MKAHAAWIVFGGGALVTLGTFWLAALLSSASASASARHPRLPEWCVRSEGRAVTVRAIWVSGRNSGCVGLGTPEGDAYVCTGTVLPGACEAEARP